MAAFIASSTMRVLFFFSPLMRFCHLLTQAEMLRLIES